MDYVTISFEPLEAEFYRYKESDKDWAWVRMNSRSDMGDEGHEPMGRILWHELTITASHLSFSDYLFVLDYINFSTNLNYKKDSLDYRRIDGLDTQYTIDLVLGTLKPKKLFKKEEITRPSIVDMSKTTYKFWRKIKNVFNR